MSHFRSKLVSKTFKILLIKGSTGLLISKGPFKLWEASGTDENLQARIVVPGAYGQGVGTRVEQ